MNLDSANNKRRQHKGTIKWAGFTQKTNYHLRRRSYNRFLHKPAALFTFALLCKLERLDYMVIGFNVAVSSKPF